jgi:hypothetical protein
MTRRTPHLLAFIALAAAAAGCREPAEPTSVFRPARIRLPGPLRRPLGEGVLIRHQADSFEELAAKLKPTCTWNGRDMLWVERDDRGRLSFTLDRAYEHHDKAGEKKWILIDFKRRRGPPGQFGGAYLRRKFALGDSIPVHDTGPGDYAVVESRGPDGEVLYRLGWEALVSGGSNNLIQNTTIFLLNDQQGRWKVVGVGMPTGTGHVGYPVCFGIDASYRVRWTRGKTSPVQIDITVHDGLTEVGEEPMGALDLLVHRDGTLATEPELGIRYAPGEYIVPERGDTLGRIAERLAWWRPFMRPEADYRRRAAEVWLGLLREGDPGLPDGVLPRNLRIQVPDEKAFRRANPTKYEAPRH